MQNYDLEPQFDNCKSFYHKAHVQESYNSDGTKTIKLTSYGTNVAVINKTVNLGDIGEALVFGTYSQTTLRHIKEFLKQNGFRADSSKQIMADYGV